MLAGIARTLDADFRGEALWLDGREVTDAIREEHMSGAASRVAAVPAVRTALLQRQRAFQEAPGAGR